MEAWLTAASTWNFLSNNQRGARVVDAGDGTRDVVAHAGQVAQRQVVGVHGGDGGQHLRLADAGLLQDRGIGGNALVDDLGGQFVMDAGEQLAAVLDQPHLMPLRDQCRS